MLDWLYNTPHTLNMIALMAIFCAGWFFHDVIDKMARRRRR